MESSVMVSAICGILAVTLMLEVISLALFDETVAVVVVVEEFGDSNEFVRADWGLADPHRLYPSGSNGYLL